MKFEKAFCEVVKFNVADIVTASQPIICNPVEMCEDEF